MKKVISLVAIAALSLGLITTGATNVKGNAATTSTTATTTTTPKRIVTYFPSWGIYQNGNQRIQVKDIPWDKVTHINHGFFEITKDFNIQTTDAWADYDNTSICPPVQTDWNKYPATGVPPGTVFGHFGAYKYYKEKYPNVKILISVGGWTRSDMFHSAASTEANRKTLAMNMVKFMQKYPFIDGMDLDWEYPTVQRSPEDQYDRGNPAGPEDKQNFTLLLKDIRETFNANGMKDKLLTVAVGAGEQKIRGTEPDKYHQYVDYIGVMTYDFAGAWDSTTGHLAPLYQNPKDSALRPKFNMNDALNIFKNEYNVPSDKLLAGSPLYSRGWSGVEPGPNGDGLYQPGNGKFVGNLGDGGQYGWYDLKKLETTAGWKKFRDPIAKAPYLYNAGTKQFLTYEDEESLQERINYINNNNYGGLIVWDASGEDFNANDPMHTIMYNGLVKGQVVPVNTAPTLSGVTNVTVNLGTTFDKMAGVTANDAEDGVLTSKIVVTGSLDTTKAGTYTLTYSVTDSGNKTTTASRVVTVVDPNFNTHPTISGATNKEIFVGDAFDPKAGVTASDTEDGVLTSKIAITGSVDTSKAGSYTQTYSVTDSKGATTTVSRVITVKTKPAANEYNPTKVYLAGDKVTYNGVEYKALWWTQGGATPDKNAAWERTTSTNPDGSLEYVPGKAYTGGQTVSYNGHTYKANWWTNTTPNTTDGSWTLIK